MIMAGLFAELVVVVGVRRSCGLLGVSRASLYRNRLGPMHGPRRRLGRPANALTDDETAAVLGVLRAPEHAELAPAQVWARLLDNGVFLCSIATMYRILRAVGEIGDRRRQRTHPAKKKPELLANRSCQVWSWDIERHEALLNRVVMKGHRHELVAAGALKLRAA